MKTVKIGIIGLGYIGRIHHRHITKIPNAEVLAVADLSKRSLIKAREEGVKKVFTDYKTIMKDAEIDAVIIALPTHLHSQCAIAAAEAHKDMLLEKPMATNIEEAKAIISSVEKNSVKLMIGYPYRFCKKFIEIREKIDNGQMGDIESVSATYINSGPFYDRAEGYVPVPVPDWWFNKQLTGGGVLMDLGSHIINLLRMFFGEITDIKSVLGHRFNMDFEDSAVCIAKFDSGTVAEVNVGWYSQDFFFKVDFLGSVRNASVTRSPPNFLSRVKQLLTTGRLEFFQPHFDELSYFVDCVANNNDPSPTGYDGLKDIEAIRLAYKNEISL